MAYASKKRAYGICDISGFRYRLKDMKMTWDGLLVGPDQAADGNDNNFFTVYTNVGNGILGTTLQTFGITCSVGTVEVTTS